MSPPLVEVNLFIMNRTRLLGALALAVALVLGAISYNGNSAQAAPGIVGPDISSTAPFTPIVGVPFNVLVETTGTTPNPYAGYAIGMVYGNTSLTANGVTDLSTGTLWASTLIPAPPNLTDNFGGLLTAPQMAVTYAVTSLVGGTSAVGPLANVNFTGVAPGVTALHKTTFVDFGNDTLFGSFGTYTIDAGASAPQLSNYLCGSVPTSGPPTGTGACGPLPVSGSTAADNVLIIQMPAPTLTMSKTADAVSVVAGGQAFNYTLTVGNSALSLVPATSVSVVDTLPAEIPVANVTLLAGCTNLLQVVTCTAASIAPGTSVSFVLAVSATDPNAGGSSPSNCATASDVQGLVSPDSTPVTSCVVVQIIPPAVAWSKDPTVFNDFIASGNGAFTFQEIMTNQGDPNGLGGFSFDIHYDPTIFAQPTIDMSPAIALFLAGGSPAVPARSRVLICTPSIVAIGLVHEACVSTGTFGQGPMWVGAQVMANVTMTPLEIVTEQVRPNKENGIVTPVKDTNVVVTNTCGQPLNDGTIQPVPGQPECQGLPLQGVGPGGALTDSMVTATIRRLEGDITKDCSVSLADMQLEASKFGMSVGNLLYNLFYDVNSPLQHGDGEIDINDIQFVYGRFGSTCAVPIPAQPAQALP